VSKIYLDLLIDDDSRDYKVGFAKEPHVGLASNKGVGVVGTFTWIPTVSS